MKKVDYLQPLYGGGSEIGLTIPSCSIAAKVIAEHQQQLFSVCKLFIRNDAVSPINGLAISADDIVKIEAFMLTLWLFNLTQCFITYYHSEATLSPLQVCFHEFQGLESENFDMMQSMK